MYRRYNIRIEVDPGVSCDLSDISPIAGCSISEPSNWVVSGNPQARGLTSLVRNGEWWRLVTSTFIHGGILHLFFNMYALLAAGLYLEPILGKVRYITAYLCTGIVASMTSLWWHGETAISAGASGAIFGLYGVFLAILTTNLLPKRMRSAFLSSVGLFVVLNLTFGATVEAVDNAAHIGGLLSGITIGYIFYFSFRRKAFTAGLAAFLVGSLTVAATVFFITTPREKPDSAPVATLGSGSDRN